jgi:hypothetical protein
MTTVPDSSTGPGKLFLVPLVAPGVSRERSPPSGQCPGGSPPEKPHRFRCTYALCHGYQCGAAGWSAGCESWRKYQGIETPMEGASGSPACFLPATTVPVAGVTFAGFREAGAAPCPESASLHFCDLDASHRLEKGLRSGLRMNGHRDSLRGHRCAASLPAARNAGTALNGSGSPQDCLHLRLPASISVTSNPPLAAPDISAPRIRGALMWRREGDSNPRYWFTQYTRLAGEPDRPLRHLSKAFQITFGVGLAQGFLPEPASTLQNGSLEGWPSG